MSTNEWITGEERLTKRVKWLYKCNDISFFNIYAAHVWNRRRSYYLALTTGLVKDAVIDGRLVKTPDYTSPPRCYWLGSYPIYWDGKRDTVTYAHVKADGPRWPLGKRPSHSTIPGWNPTREQINEYAVRDDSGRVLVAPWGTDPRLTDKLEEWATIYEAQKNKKPTPQEITKMGYFFGIKWELTPPGTPFLTKGLTPDPTWISLEKQQTTIDNMDKVISDCIKKNYRDSPQEPQKRFKTPRGPAEWPGKPIPQLDLPTPTRAPSPGPPLAGTETLKLTISFGFTPSTSPDGLIVQLELI